MVRRALTRQTRWYQNRCSTFKIESFIVQKPFWKILEFWPLVTSILTWAKKWPKWFRNDFSRAFERRFPFCSTMRRSRDRRGGVFKHPPPPSRWWKIQRPSRARVKRAVCMRFLPTSKAYSLARLGLHQGRIEKVESPGKFTKSWRQLWRQLPVSLQVSIQVHD